MAVGAVVLGGSAVHGEPPVPEECVAAKVATGLDRPAAVAECLQEARQAAPTTAATATTNPTTFTPATTQPAATEASSDDGGTSVALVVAVGLAGVLIGAAGALLLARGRRRVAPPAATAGQAAAPPPVAPPPMAAPPPSDRNGDRVRGLVTGLVELSDRLPSQALRAEVIAVLQRADVQPIEVPTGERFDPAHMRGVGAARATDATWVGRVASTERCGFRDGASVVRQPEVIVYTADG
jgi:hypothetical protein